ncbi:glycosyltransferase [Bacteriovoracaceae bacterium]|nr:glycosyltransferase [Bacteriovoracaceae bacterium]
MLKYIVITNTFNRPIDLVEKSITKSLAQHPTPAKMILIDQNTNALVFNKDITENLIFTSQSIQTKIVSEARNDAKLEIDSNYDWIVFCDDDGYMSENYAQVLQKEIEKNPEVEIFAGGILRDDNNKFYTPRHSYGGDLNKFQNTKLLMGSNFAIKKETFLKLEKFDIRFGAGSFWGSGEETDFAWKAYFNKIPMKYVKELTIYHIPPYAGDFVHSIKKAFKYGLGKGALVSKWLFFKRHPIVLYEFLEMLIIPFIKTFTSLIKFQFKEVPYYMASFLSRIIGMIYFIFVRK